MPFAIGTIAAKDGGGTTITGGLLAADTTGTGPWFLFYGVVDGVAGSNKAQVDSSNRLRVSSLISDGTNSVTIKAASSGGAVPTDVAAVVTLRDQNANGQTTMTNSAPVAIASDQSKLPVHGDVASGATDAGNPIKIGGLAKTTNPTAVTDGQRVAGLFDKLGKLIVNSAVRELKGTQKTTITSSTAETTIVTAAGAGVFADVYSLLISNTSATAVNVTIKDSTAGTTRFIIPVPAGDVRGFALPADAAHSQATANNNWTATCSASVASVEITALFVKNL